MNRQTFMDLSGFFFSEPKHRYNDGSALCNGVNSLRGGRWEFKFGNSRDVQEKIFQITSEGYDKYKYMCDRLDNMESEANY